jgi:FKBP-type peptidyl-prolyl cis-trans isomerase SlyD
MNNRKVPNLVGNDMVVSMAYVLTVDGEIIDSTEEGESLQFIQGYGSIIPGLEQALYGIEEGATKRITVPANDAYGEYDLEQIIPIPMSEFPVDLDLEPGLEMEMKDKEGDIVYARIVSVGKRRVKMDFNHPLAGQDLDFEITILSLRPATALELKQGFVE